MHLPFKSLGFVLEESNTFIPRGCFKLMIGIVNTFMMFQKINVSNTCCSFYIFILNFHKNVKQQNYF